MTPAKSHRRLRLLMLSDQTYPSPHAELVEIFARRLPEFGVDVHWIMRGREDGEVQWDRSRATVCRGTTGFWARWALAVMLLRAARVASRWRPDWIVTRNDVTLGLLSMTVRALVGGKFAFQVSFPLPETYIALARTHRVVGWRLKILYWKLNRLLRNWILRRCDLVLPISEAMGEEHRKAGVAPGRIWPLPMGAVVGDLPPPEAVIRLRREIGTSNSKVVLYFGVIRRIRQLDVLIRALPRVIDMFPDTCLLMLGPAPKPDKQELMELVEELGLSRAVRFLDPVPREEIPLWIGAADVTVSPIPMEDYYMVSSPTKAVESLALGVPVVVTPIPDQKQLVAESGGGVCVGFTPEHLADGIVQVLRDPAAWRQAGIGAREYIRARRDWGVLAEKLAHRLRL